MITSLHDMSGKKVAVIGAGVEGLAVARFLNERGALVEIRDRQTANSKQRSEIREQVQKEEITFSGGIEYLEGLADFDLIVRSPGVPWLTPELIEAREAGVPVTSQTELFITYSKASIIGVTGTKGKSTTAALLVHILQEAGKKVRFGGNVGEPIIQWLDDLATDEFVVLELSSFQLQGLSVSPHAAVVLDITTEHLDHHRTRDEYIAAKRSIVQHQKKEDIAILNADSLTAVDYGASTKATIWWFSNHKFVDPGVYVKDIAGEQWFEARSDETESLLIPIEDLKILGFHNWSNAAAAASTASALGIAFEHIISGLQSFTGLPHRIQALGRFGDREWIDDSYATAPDATIAALATLAGAPVVLIVGGSSKGYGFEDLASHIVAAAPKAVVQIGETGPAIEQAVQEYAATTNASMPRFVAGGDTMMSIVNQAYAVSEKGDTILFSPGCASFGLFKNASDRASQFVQAVQQIGA